MWNKVKLPYQEWQNEFLSLMKTFDINVWEPYEAIWIDEWGRVRIKSIRRQDFHSGNCLIILGYIECKDTLKVCVEDAIEYSRAAGINGYVSHWSIRSLKSWWRMILGLLILEYSFEEIYDQLMASFILVLKPLAELKACCAVAVRMLGKGVEWGLQKVLWNHERSQFWWT